MTRPEITVEVSSTSGLEVEQIPIRQGWGENGHETTLRGEVAKILIRRGDDSHIGFQVEEDGSIHITSYGGPFKLTLPQNVTLQNMRPWKTE